MGCSHAEHAPHTVPPPSAIDSTTPTAPPAPAITIPVADLPAAFTIGNADFAVNILRAAAPSANDNVFLAPYSISVALAMTYAGASGPTASEMRNVLELGVPDDHVGPSFASLDAALSARGQGHAGVEGSPLRVDVASSLWGQSGVSYGQPFLDTLTNQYHAPFGTLDFASSVAAAAAINGWVSTNTDGNIPTILPPNVLDAQTRLVIANALYFNASWASAFDDPKPMAFTDRKNNVTQIPMLERLAKLPYTSGSDYQAVLVPYADEDLAMLAIVPQVGTFDSFLSSLTGTQVIGMLDAMTDTQVDLSFPTMHIEESYELTNPLRALGMNAAFGLGADFSHITTQTDHLHVSAVLHKTMTDVTKEGTIASAATVVVAGGALVGHGPPSCPIVSADHPFLMAIVDRPTKTLLFLGEIVAPPAAPRN
jgi:serpin B